MNTLKNQRTLDWEFAGLYADKGLSGTSYETNSINQMIEDAKLTN